MEALLSRMPFPAHFDQKIFGPSCLDWDHCYWQPKLDLDAMVTKFWQSEFRGFSDYGQRMTPKKWSELTLEKLYEVMAKAPTFYRAPFNTFMEQLTAKR